MIDPNEAPDSMEAVDVRVELVDVTESGVLINVPPTGQELGCSDCYYCKLECPTNDKGCMCFWTNREDGEDVIFKKK